MRKNPNPEMLFDRATESAKETRQAIITLSSASLAVFFVALTTKTDPVLTVAQKYNVLFALIAMAFSIFAGLWSAWADARWSYSWGREIENREQDEELWRKEKDTWHKRIRWGENYSLLAFTIGVLLAGVYIVLRIFDL